MIVTGSSRRQFEDVLVISSVLKSPGAWRVPQDLVDIIEPTRVVFELEGDLGVGGVIRLVLQTGHDTARLRPTVAVPPLSASASSKGRLVRFLRFGTEEFRSCRDFPKDSREGCCLPQRQSR